jgi:hypothetical protein
MILAVNSQEHYDSKYRAEGYNSEEASSREVRSGDGFEVGLEPSKPTYRFF